MLELVDFFAKLEAANLRYAVLRNYEGLPFDWGNDIDILVHPDDLAQAAAIVHCVFRFNEPKARYQRMKRWNFTAYLIESTEPRLQIDFYTGLSKAWFIYADTSTVLQRTRRTRAGIRIPHLRDELELIAAKELFSYGRLRRKYHADFRAKSRQVLGNEGQLFAGRLTPASIASIQHLIDDPTHSGRLWPTAATLFAPRRFYSWLRQRANRFS